MRSSAIVEGRKVALEVSVVLRSARRFWKGLSGVGDKGP